MFFMDKPTIILTAVKDILYIHHIIFIKEKMGAADCILVNHGAGIRTGNGIAEQPVLQVMLLST